MQTTADKFKDFCSTYLTLSDNYVGKPFDLEPWQEDFADILFADDEEGKRRFRQVILELARKKVNRR